MRIGIVELYCGSSGKKGFYNSQEIGIARAMARIGYECVIFYPHLDGKKIVEEAVDKNILIVYVPAKALGVHSHYDWRVLLKYKIDVVQLGADNQLFTPSITHFCDKNRIRIYNYIGTIQSDTDRRFKAKIMSYLYLHNLKVYKKHKCFAKTHTVMNELNRMGVDEITVAPVGLDTTVVPKVLEARNQLRYLLKLPVDKIVLLFVGRMDEYKRPNEAVELVNRLSNQYFMVMIGTGSMDDEVERQISILNLNDRILRIKKIPNIEIHKYYCAADYYLNFNGKEIFGMSILEAMYQDCTVLAIDAPGPKEIIKNGETGFIVSSIEEMKQLICSEAKIKKDQARNSIINEFTWDKTAEKFDEWIRGKNG